MTEEDRQTDDNAASEQAQAESGRGNDDLYQTLIFEERTIAEPPKTWTAYLQRKDYWGIVEMEYGEARKAMEGFKKGTSSIKDAIHELGHVASASALARSKLMELAAERNILESGDFSRA